jgi:hypothetical protein
MEESNGPSTISNSNPSGHGSTRTRIAIGAAVIIGLAAFIVIIILFLRYPGTTQTVRDIFIIALAFESFVVGALLVFLLYQLIAVLRLLRDDIKPVIDSAQETMTTVKGTATFMSEQVTQPAIKASGYAAGIRRSISVLLDLVPRRRASTQRSAGEEN